MLRKKKRGCAHRLSVRVHFSSASLIRHPSSFENKSIAPISFTRPFMCIMQWYIFTRHVCGTELSEQRERASHVKRQTSHLTPHTSHLTPHTFQTAGDHRRVKGEEDRICALFYGGDINRNCGGECDHIRLRRSFSLHVCRRFGKQASCMSSERCANLVR